MVGGDSNRTGDAMGSDTSARDTGGSSESGSPGDSGPGDSALPCMGEAGPLSIRLGPFCVDKTEVTHSDYAAFLAAGYVTTDPRCTWKTSNVPASGTPHPTAPKVAVGGVDWCDAFMYCAWAGKRLCGKIGSGGAVNMVQADDPTVDEWYDVCSDGGALTYPYGDTYEATWCNGRDLSGGSGAVDVGSLPMCRTGTGAYDLSGNVWEWEDSCDDAGAAGGPAHDNCLSRGGSWAQPENGLSCNLLTKFERGDNSAFDYGIRCCSN